ncbi:glycosyltransferase family 4 protein [Burkholderia cenocepacia]|uniref:glycosyltransferase family 4 protein n=1 Tax=Burkholderia cenocepacia TaxID=95486 RepID=UPI001882C460|nr:glycosyltransferase family 4 protein [Burkholderia cenocepacia]MCW3499256.1 glycosyltransferase family 4 protein [Burkholderia cenocepacia]MCW3506840.1 glycosyltransferase family 4 protein [Burkholderia cenocepacia]MCW3514187.1 glycosyltransferase family 4 protein [Burkholderia cenocepacia]MCW3530966.1 glycosyltransferase family 4 protein [Burkholderia cenocepacia]MCW3545291.1 glycosyltransferase family 4 protein [Burkholderia cenocepacia]
MKISYVNGICVKNDAISNSIRDEIRALRESGIDDIRLFAYVCEHDDLPSKVVSNVADIAYDAHFLESDVVIFHFGIYYPLFDLLSIVPARAKRVVVFHNVTPREFVKPESRSLIDQSFSQMSNIAWADHVICVSDTNLDVLREAGINTPATVLPLAIHSMSKAPTKKPSVDDDTVRMAFIGRFVKSKGPHELLMALGNVLESNRTCRLRLDMVGNLLFSDPELLAQIEVMMASLMQQYGHRISLKIHGNASEAQKHEILQDADLFVLPTYHEGFGVPIVEAISNGCYIIAYDNSNVPSVTNGFGQLVETGSLEGLSSELGRAVERMTSPTWRGKEEGSYASFVKRASRYAEDFSPSKVARRFVNLVNNIQ